MRAVFGAARWLSTVAFVLGAGPAIAETINIQNSSQFGMTLPQATMPNGQDEIRTSDGTSCRSSVGGSGAYFDAGVIGQPETSDIEGSAAAYGRIVVPPGDKPKRLDCTHLYSLEIERLKMELQVAKMGLSGKGNSQEAEIDEAWANEGWSNGKDSKDGKDTKDAKPSKVNADVSSPDDEALQTQTIAPIAKVAQPAKMQISAADVLIVEPASAPPETQAIDTLY
jgi:hypothetical protein